MTGCCLCGLDIECLVEDAHVPDRVTSPDDIARLCILCHRAYDLGLVTDDEVRSARDGWMAGRGAAFAGRIEDLRALWRGRTPSAVRCSAKPNTERHDWSRLQKGAQVRAGKTIRRRAAARRAARTRARNRDGSTGSSF